MWGGPRVAHHTFIHFVPQRSLIHPTARHISGHILLLFFSFLSSLIKECVDHGWLITGHRDGAFRNTINAIKSAAAGGRRVSEWVSICRDETPAERVFCARVLTLWTSDKGVIQSDSVRKTFYSLLQWLWIWTLKGSPRKREKERSWGGRFKNRLLCKSRGRTLSPRLWNKRVRFGQACAASCQQMSVWGVCLW